MKEDGACERVSEWAMRKEKAYERMSEGACERNREVEIVESFEGSFVLFNFDVTKTNSPSRPLAHTLTRPHAHTLIHSHAFVDTCSI